MYSFFSEIKNKTKSLLRFRQLDLHGVVNELSKLGILAAAQIVLLEHYGLGDDILFEL